VDPKVTEAGIMFMRMLMEAIGWMSCMAAAGLVLLGLTHSVVDFMVGACDEICDSFCRHGRNKRGNS